MMKNLRKLLVLTALCATATLNAKAQNPYEDLKYPYATDSLVYEENDQGSWVVESRQKYTIYPDRRPDNMRFYQGATSSSYLFDYVYDGNNKFLGYDLKFNFGGQEMVITELRVLRDAQGNVIEEIIKELDQPGAPLENRDRVLYTYNAQNQLVLELSEQWDDNISPAAWVTNNKSIYAYDANGKRISQVDSFWSTSNEFFFSNKRTFAYNANGKLISETNLDAANTEKSRTTYTYNPAGFLTEELYEVKESGNYKMYSKDSIILDASNMVIQEFVYNFDFQVNKVIMTGRMNALGSAVGIFSENKLLKQLLAYPNPTEGLVNLKLNGTSDKNVEVYNLLGEKVMDVTLSGTQRTIDLSSLSNGIYNVKVMSAEGNYQNKVILSK
jgi:YD repeat-containing protein